MLEFESAIISKVLAGDRPPMPSLREKARNLRVVTRSRSQGEYALAFHAPRQNANTPFRGPKEVDWLCLSIE